MQWLVKPRPDDIYALACYWRSSSEMPEQISWMRWLPGVLTLRQYRPNWLPRDIVAGVVLATMLVPVGIAYAVASGVPGINGLYATIIPLLAYAVFGPQPDPGLRAGFISG